MLRRILQLSEVCRSVNADWKPLPFTIFFQFSLTEDMPVTENKKFLNNNDLQMWFWCSGISECRMRAVYSPRGRNMKNLENASPKHNLCRDRI